MPVFEYEIRPEPAGPTEYGELTANDEKDAWRQLRVQYCRPHLPPNTRVTNQDDRLAEEQRARSAKLHRLLRVLAAHHQWLDNPATGERADLRGLDLSGVSLRGARLAQAMLGQSDLSRANLAGADLSGANLTGAILEGTVLVGADLSRCDLSEADLRAANLSGAVLDGVDAWRANLQGCAIDPAALHALLGCRAAEAVDPAEVIPPLDLDAAGAEQADPPVRLVVSP